ncbi:hypothetical protein H6G28_27325, partial [Nostoc sp. FACHB-190]|nr:hypothetical protein [Nostoc sp. FACHB-190]
MLTRNQKTPIYFDAEIVDDSSTSVTGDEYDSQLLQQAIAETDSSITICSELQTSRAKTANKAILKPHYLQIRFCSKRHYLQMKL